MNSIKLVMVILDFLWCQCYNNMVMKDFETSGSHEPTIAIHTLPNSSDQMISRFLDGGKLVDHLNERGYTVSLTNRDVFDATSAAHRVISSKDNYTLEPTATDISSIDAMYSRLAGPVRRPGIELIPKLNSNELKTLAGSKIELYRQVLSEYQVPTEFVSMQAEDFNETADLIHAVATDTVVIKGNGGFGGASTNVLEKKDAIAWVAQQIEAGNEKPQILQPKIEFGRLPDGIRGVGEDQALLVERARKENLLTELRFYALKKNDTIDTVPVLRVVPTTGLPMQGSNDVYVEIDLSDDLREALDEITRAIVRKATAAANGDNHAIGAVDYYFDAHALPHVMEANFRTPGLPASNLLPRAGRLAHTLLADVLVSMAQNESVADKSNKERGDHE